ncbi:GumC family protein [Acuticoccus kandeliae]|uniref:GumC family protein n=1 Tax=Acuticoccus kandeliae TaxID=2073160 RepID=UPI001472B32C|nr:exopolysaccharide transport family protein [Acuticoccus kandeliae]
MTYRITGVHPSIGAPISPFAAPPPEASAADDLDWANLFRIVRRRLGLLFVVPLAVGVLALPVVLSLDPTYRATTRIAIQEPEVRQLAQAGTAARVIEPDIPLEAERIASRENVETVIAALALGETKEYAPDPRGGLLARVRGWLGLGDTKVPPPDAAKQHARMVEQFYKNLSIVRQGSSDVVEVTFRSKDAARAATVANALVRTHLEGSEARRVADIATAERWVGERVAEQRDRLRDARAALDAFEAEQAAAGARTMSNDTAEIETLNARSAAITLEETELKSQLAQIEATSGDVLAIETPMLQTLRAELAQRQRDIAVDTRKLGPAHRAVKLATAELTELERSIRLQIEDYRRSATERLSALDAQKAEVNAKLLSARRRAVDVGATDARGARLRERFDEETTALDALEQRRRDLKAEIALPRLAVEVLSPATVPLGPVPPGRKLIMIGILVAAGCLAVTIAAIVELVDRSVRSHQDVRRVPGLLPVGVLPRIKRRRSIWRRQQPWDDALFADCARGAILAMEAAVKGGEIGSVLVTSIGPGEGRSTVAAALAHALAMIGRKVLVIDADFAGSRPDVQPLSNGNRVGLAEFLRTGEGLEHAMQHDVETGLTWLAHGGGFNLPPDGRDRFASLLDAARNSGRIVIIDGPSAEDSAALMEIAGLVDHTLLVFRWGRTRRHLVAVVSEMLATIGVGSVLTIINHIDPAGHRLYGAHDRLAFAAPAGRARQLVARARPRAEARLARAATQATRLSPGTAKG